MSVYRSHNYIDNGDQGFHYPQAVVNPGNAVLVAKALSQYHSSNGNCSASAAIAISNNCSTSATVAQAVKPLVQVPPRTVACPAAGNSCTTSSATTMMNTALSQCGQLPRSEVPSYAPSQHRHTRAIQESIATTVNITTRCNENCDRAHVRRRRFDRRVDGERTPQQGNDVTSPFAQLPGTEGTNDVKQHPHPTTDSTQPNHITIALTIQKYASNSERPAVISPTNLNGVIGPATSTANTNPASASQSCHRSRNTTSSHVARITRMRNSSNSQEPKPHHRNASASSGNTEPGVSAGSCSPVRQFSTSPVGNSVRRQEVTSPVPRSDILSPNSVARRPPRSSQPHQPQHAPYQRQAQSGSGMPANSHSKVGVCDLNSDNLPSTSNPVPSSASSSSVAAAALQISRMYHRQSRHGPARIHQYRRHQHPQHPQHSQHLQRPTSTRQVQQDQPQAEPRVNSVDDDPSQGLGTLQVHGWSQQQRGPTPPPSTTSVIAAVPYSRRLQQQQQQPCLNQVEKSKVAAESKVPSTTAVVSTLEINTSISAAATTVTTTPNLAISTAVSSKSLLTTVSTAVNAAAALVTTSVSSSQHAIPSTSNAREAAKPSRRSNPPFVPRHRNRFPPSSGRPSSVAVTSEASSCKGTPLQSASTTSGVTSVVAAAAPPCKSNAEATQPSLLSLLAMKSAAGTAGNSSAKIDPKDKENVRHSGDLEIQLELLPLPASTTLAGTSTSTTVAEGNPTSIRGKVVSLNSQVKPLTPTTPSSTTPQRNSSSDRKPQRRRHHQQQQMHLQHNPCHEQQPQQLQGGSNVGNKGTVYSSVEVARVVNNTLAVVSPSVAAAPSTNTTIATSQPPAGDGIRERNTHTPRNDITRSKVAETQTLSTVLAQQGKQETPTLCGITHLPMLMLVTPQRSGLPNLCLLADALGWQCEEKQKQPPTVTVTPSRQAATTPQASRVATKALPMLISVVPSRGPPTALPNLSLLCSLLCPSPHKESQAPPQARPEGKRERDKGHAMEGGVCLRLLTSVDSSSSSSVSQIMAASRFPNLSLLVHTFC